MVAASLFAAWNLSSSLGSFVEPAHAPPSLEAEPAGREVHSEHFEHAKLHQHLVALALTGRWWHLGVYLGENLHPQGLDRRDILLRAGRTDGNQKPDDLHSVRSTNEQQQLQTVLAGRVL